MSTAPRPRDRLPTKVIAGGRLRVSVWENPGPNGLWYSVTACRLFTGDDGRECTSVSFGRDDLLPLAELVREAWWWVTRQEERK
jgi:hypothetical protein